MNPNRPIHLWSNRRTDGSSKKSHHWADNKATAYEVCCGIPFTVIIGNNYIRDWHSVLWRAGLLCFKSYIYWILQEIPPLVAKGDLNLTALSFSSMPICQSFSSIAACLSLPKSKAGLVKVGRGWAEILDVYLYMCVRVVSEHEKKKY